MSGEAFILDAVRTPFGRAGGALAGVRPDDLAAHAVRALLERAHPHNHETLHSTTLGWRMVNPEMPEEWTISLGESTEKAAGIYGISARRRTSSRSVATSSPPRRGTAASTTPWVVPVPVRDGEHARDEGIRADASVAGLAKLNEAFAAQSLACFGEWKDLDPEKLNVNGGAIAIGHPLGASGVRILGTLAHELRRRGGGWGIAAICIGVGQGLAVVIEA